MRHLLAFVRVHVEEAILGVVVALIEVVAREFLVALSALELDHAGKKFPEEVFPGDFLRAQAQHKFV